VLCSEAILVNAGDLDAHATIMRCKRWSCELCRPFNHRLTKRRAREGRPNVFLTLTVNPARYSTFDEAARDLKRAWVNLRRAMKREHGVEQPPFIAIFEATKRGWPHLHILMRCKFIPQRWFSATMDRLIGAPIVDVRHIDELGRVAAYVAKYVSKAPTAFKGCKRWWRSHDFQLDKEEGETFKRFSPYVTEQNKTLRQFAHDMGVNGWTTREESDSYVRMQRWWVREADEQRTPGGSRYASARS
jgi:hypothetical protein